MKKLFKIFFMFTIAILTTNIAIGDNEQKLKAGTLVKVIPSQEINTLSADKDDSFTFINLNNMYVYETNAIPENTIFYGIVEDVKEPVQGRDGAIKIAVNKMITPDKKVYEIKGHIYSNNDNYIGGKQTPYMYYHKLYNHSKGFKPFLQAVPLNIYEKGKHTIIRPGSELFVVIEDDIVLK